MLICCVNTFLKEQALEKHWGEGGGQGGAGQGAGSVKGDHGNMGHAPPGGHSGEASPLLSEQTF